MPTAFGTDKRAFPGCGAAWSEAERCAADPGSTITHGPRVCTATLRIAVRPGNVARANVILRNRGARFIRSALGLAFAVNPACLTRPPPTLGRTRNEPTIFAQRERHGPCGRGRSGHAAALCAAQRGRAQQPALRLRACPMRRLHG